MQFPSPVTLTPKFFRKKPAVDAHVLPLSSSLLFGRRDFGDVVIQLKCGTSLAAVSPCFIFKRPAFSTTVRFFSKFSGTGSHPPSPADSFSRPPPPVASVRFSSSFSCCRCFLSSFFCCRHFSFSSASARFLSSSSCCRCRFLSSSCCCRCFSFSSSSCCCYFSFSSSCCLLSLSSSFST